MFQSAEAQVTCGDAIVSTPGSVETSGYKGSTLAGLSWNAVAPSANHTTYYEVTIGTSSFVTSDTSVSVSAPGSGKAKVAALSLNSTSQCLGKSPTSSAVSWPDDPKTTITHTKVGNNVTFTTPGSNVVVECMPAGSTARIIVATGPTSPVWFDLYPHILDSTFVPGTSITCTATSTVTGFLTLQMSNNVTVAIPRLTAPATEFALFGIDGGVLNRTAQLGGMFQYTLPHSILSAPPDHVFGLEIKYRTVDWDIFKLHPTRSSNQGTFSTAGMEQFGDVQFRAFSEWWNGTHTERQVSAPTTVRTPAVSITGSPTLTMSGTLGAYDNVKYKFTDGKYLEDVHYVIQYATGNTWYTAGYPDGPSGVIDKNLIGDSDKSMIKFRLITTWEDAFAGTSGGYVSNVVTINTPYVSISSNGDVTEGSNAVFTITATPAPAAPLSVPLNITQSGSFTSQTGIHTVTVPTSGSTSYSVSTINDHTDENNGHIDIRLGDSVGAIIQDRTARAHVNDNDETHRINIHSTSDSITEGSGAVFNITATPAPPIPLSVSLAISQSGSFTSKIGNYTATIPTSGILLYTVPTTNDHADEPNGYIQVQLKTVTGLNNTIQHNNARVNVVDAYNPQVSISSNGDVTEGSNAVFTLTATPAPSAPLSVSITVSQGGTYTNATGTFTVTVPTSGSVPYSVPTTNDHTDEPDGHIMITLNGVSGDDTSVSPTPAYVYVRDNDVMRHVSVSGGANIVEGSEAVFTITATPAPSAPLSVSITVSQGGTYTDATGTFTVTVPTSGTLRYAVLTTGDSVDEPNGYIQIRLNSAADANAVILPISAYVYVSDND